MAIVLNGTTGIANDGGYTGDGVVFADTTPANTLVTTTGGNVGIGTSSPAAKLQVASSTTNSTLKISNSTTGSASGDGLDLIADGTDGYVWNRENGPLLFGTNNAERARIDSSGNLLVGTTSNLYTGTRFSTQSTNASYAAAEFRVNATSALATPASYFSKEDNNSTTSNVFCKFVIGASGAAGSGQINANGANAAAFGAWSDRRLKENIVDLPSQLANIMALRPVEYNYIESEGGGHQIGFVAQEVQTIYPDLVGEREDGMLTLTDLNKNDARLIKAIQEQQALITALTARVTALENQP